MATGKIGVEYILARPVLCSHKDKPSEEVLVEYDKVEDEEVEEEGAGL